MPLRILLAVTSLLGEKALLSFFFFLFFSFRIFSFQGIRSLSLSLLLSADSTYFFFFKYCGLYFICDALKRLLRFRESYYLVTSQ